MIYTAKSREELIEQVKEYLKSEELHVKTEDESKGEYSLMYILTRKFSPEKTIVVASNESGGVYIFYPYGKQEDFSEPWDFDADRLLFELLGESYEITYMTDISPFVQKLHQIYGESVTDNISIIHNESPFHHSNNIFTFT